jgi:DNA-binding NtrC family response regulator
MNHPRRVLIVESDAQACEQMKRVFAAMNVTVAEARDLETASDAAAELARNAAPPDLIVARVTLPDGSGVQVLNQIGEMFPDARQVMVSHFPKRLLISIPGFADRMAEFLQAEFTDDQFRKVVERSFARTRTA